MTSNTPLKFSSISCVPKTQNSVAFFQKLFVSLAVFFTILRVLASIQFDDQFLFETNKIDNKFVYWLLTPKFKTIDLFST